MLLRLFLLALPLLLSGCAFKPGPPPPQVMLKLDDAWFEGDSIHPGWVETFDYLNERGVVATIGVVGDKMEGGNEAFFHWLTTQTEAGHEIWNHGYCHCKPVVDGEEVREFRGTDYEYQLDHLRKTQAICAEKLGIELQTFGAPYNACDSNTTRALANIQELKIWLYPPSKNTAGKFALFRTPVNIEYPVHQPDFDAFVENYRVHKDAPVLIIQGHPRSWVEPGERMEEFKRIVDFLIEQRTKFTTPRAYYANDQNQGNN